MLVTSETRVIVLMQPKLRDDLKAIGKSEGRVLMRQIEHICKEFVAARKPEPIARKRRP